MSLYFTIYFFSFFVQKKYASCLSTIARIEFLESGISGSLASFLYSLLKKKYDPSVCDKTDPYIQGVLQRFSTDGQKKFLASNIIVLKPYISPKEKGVILLNYTEVINAFPFLFDLYKIQERYHIVLEPSWESPFQMYNKFFLNTSHVFVQTLSQREIKVVTAHGFTHVGVCAGDWINENNFFRIKNEALTYDFCAIANFIPFKRHIQLLAAISKYWKGDLKFALIASSHIGEKREWAEDLIKKNGLEGKVDIFIDIAPEQVGQILNRSKCHVLYSLREGANRANFESMFVGTPVVVHKDHIGFPNFRFGVPMVANYTTPENLVDAIKKCVTANRDEVYDQAHKLIGSAIATKTLNDCIKKTTLDTGGEWTKDIYRKVNNVHTFYFDQENTKACINDYQFLQDSLADNKCYDMNLAIKKFSTGTLSAIPKI